MSVSNLKLLENFIGYLSTRNKVISQNIANIGTDEYIRQDVKFQDVLNKEIGTGMKVTNKHHVRGNRSNSGESSFEVFIDKNKEGNGGINNVDIETEMANMAENSINFKFAARKINAHFRQLSEVIKGGGSR